MRPVHDPAPIMLPSEVQKRALEETLLFSPRTIRIVYGGAGAIGIGLIVWAMLDRSALLTPVDPDFRAVLIGLGIFLGVLVAAIEREAWLLGFGGSRAPKGIFVAVAVIALVAASGFGGDFLARKMWAWRAFHGVHPAGVDRVFTVTGRSNGRSGSSLELRDPATDRTFSIGCADAVAAAARIGDRLILPVETGRGGVQRVTMPASKDLRRA